MRWAVRIAWLALLLIACSTAPTVHPSTVSFDHRLYVTSNDWHTRIVVATRDIPAGLLPEATAFPAAAWLAIGWGDHRYYPMRDPPAWLGLRAALLPGPAVVHLIPLQTPPRLFGGLEVLEIAVSHAGLTAMLEAIDQAFDRSGESSAPVAAPGLYPGSLFFPSVDSFHLFNTCNTWVARQLQAAGLPVEPAGVITAQSLLRQLRPLSVARPSLG